MGIAWLPKGITIGQEWWCELALTDPGTGRPRKVTRCFAAIGRRLPNGTFERLVRFDDSLSPGTGTARMSGAPANVVRLYLDEDTSADLPPAAEAYLEVWVVPPEPDEMYCLIEATPIPLTPKAAILP